MILCLGASGVIKAGCSWPKQKQNLGLKYISGIWLSYIEHYCRGVLQKYSVFILVEKLMTIMLLVVSGIACCLSSYYKWANRNIGMIWSLTVNLSVCQNIFDHEVMTDLINIAIPSTTENSDTVRIQYTGDSVPPGVT